MRKRPGMYIGDTSDGTGLHHLVFEVVDNSIDEALAGHCDDIVVTIHTDNSISRHRQRSRHPDRRQDGRQARAQALGSRNRTDRAARRRQVQPELLQGLGRPARRGRVLRQRAVEVAAPDDPPRWQEASHRIRRACRTIGLSKRATVSTTADESHRRDRQARHRSALLAATTKSSANVEFHYDILAKRLRELSFLNNGVSITPDRRAQPARKTTFAFAGGVKGFVEYINREQDGRCTRTSSIAGRSQGGQGASEPASTIGVEVAMQWNDVLPGTGALLHQQHPAA